MKKLTQSEYPFKEGDKYFTIENGIPVQSCWDDVSEEIHNENPNRIYFKTFAEAVDSVKEVETRLEHLRTELRAERISYGELIELQNLAEYIDKGDVELLEAAGVPENAQP